MKISNQLPQFEEQLTLIIVASKQAADLHLAHDGELDTVSEIRVEKPQYSDREGHFKRSSRGQDLGSGSPVKERDKKAKQDFLLQLQEALKNLHEEVTVESTVLLMPSQHKNDIKKKLPSYIRNTVITEIAGNFVDDHPKDILERIQDSE